MKFDCDSSVLYTDTPVPDIFLSEYMPSMRSEYVKVYLYCLFLCKYNKSSTQEEISKKLCLDRNVVNDAFIYLESIGLLTTSNETVIIADLKQKEINKIYRPKVASTPEEVAANCERNKKRNQTIAAINNTFFQGVMSPHGIPKSTHGLINTILMRTSCMRCLTIVMRTRLFTKTT